MASLPKQGGKTYKRHWIISAVAQCSSRRKIIELEEYGCKHSTKGVPRKRPKNLSEVQAGIMSEHR